MGKSDVRDNTSKPKNKTRFVLLIVGLLVVLFLAIVTFTPLTTSANSCKACHSMQPEYVTWKVSAHANIRCVDCHASSKGLGLSANFAAFRYVLTEVTGGWSAPIKVAEPISADTCKTCHTTKRTYNFPGDLIVPHDKHDKKGIACVQCHKGVAHGQITERKVNGNKDNLAKWTAADGQNNMMTEFTRPSMDTCIECHHSRGVNIKCEACHQTIFTPDDHKNTKTWIPSHGLNAEKNLQPCNKCHSYGMKMNKNVKTGDATRDYAWGNNYCAKCHAEKPNSHKDREVWMPTHKDVVKQKGMKNCQACHAIKEADAANSPAAGVFCNRCHVFK